MDENKDRKANARRAEILFLPSNVNPPASVFATKGFEDISASFVVEFIARYLWLIVKRHELTSLKEVFDRDFLSSFTLDISLFILADSGFI